ncbi:MAG: hypothetical protein OXQ29_14725 [Rhodospirillaceae bacterium]|nr:hypothetical protein [Rhodospirillaceae bacterium]
MTRTNSLQAVLDRAGERQESQPVDVPSGPERQPAPGRAGRRLIGGHFDPRVAKKLKVLAAEEEATVQALLEEAVDLLFVKRGLPPGAA